MRCKKTVYICDHCGAVALEETYFFYIDEYKGPPEYWAILGNEHLCPVCSEIYRRLKNEVKKDMEDERCVI